MCPTIVTIYVNRSKLPTLSYLGACHDNFSVSELLVILDILNCVGGSGSAGNVFNNSDCALNRLLPNAFDARILNL